VRTVPATTQDSPLNPSASLRHQPTMRTLRFSLATPGGPGPYLGVHCLEAIAKILLLYHTKKKPVSEIARTLFADFTGTTTVSNAKPKASYSLLLIRGTHR
jgi:hypothetical protein